VTITSDEVIWSNWWGSPEAFAGVVEEIEAALAAEAGTATLSITVGTGSYRRDLTSTDSFRGLAPELIPKLRTITASCSGGEAEVAFELKRFGPFSREKESATLRVNAPDPWRAEELIRRLTPHAAQGYQPYWGGCTAPAKLRAEARDRGDVPYLLTRVLVSVFVGFPLGIGIAIATADIGIRPIPAAASLVGFLIPLGINFLVPDVQIASDGSTRVVAVRKYFLGALLAAAVGWAKGVVGF
jgi:hypothetical protein